MATWNQLASYVATKYVVQEQTDRMIRMRLRFPDGRSQFVFLWRQDLDGDDWVEIESPIGSVGSFDALAVLHLVGELVCGGLTVTDGFYCLKHSAPLANLDLNELEDPLALVVGSAADLERKLTGADNY